MRRLRKLEALKIHFSEAFGIDFHLDHHIPLSRGGEHAPENLVIMPGATNLAKGDKLPGTEWTPPAPVFARVTYRVHRVGRPFNGVESNETH